MAAYKDMYDRIGRLLVKIRDQNRSNLEYKDDLDSFFIYCFHMKDHLKNEGALSHTIVESFVDGNRYLRLCADLANRTKHLVLSRSIRDNASFGKKSIGVNIHTTVMVSDSVSITVLDNKGNKISSSEVSSDKSKPSQLNGEVEIDQHYEVLDNHGNIFNALDLAEKCFDAWAVFLHGYGLL